MNIIKNIKVSMKKTWFIPGIVILSVFSLLAEVTLAESTTSTKINKTKITKISKLQESEKEFEFPPGCTRVGFSYKLHVLNLHPEANGENPQSIYFIYNKNNKAVKFYQMRTGDDPYIMHTNNRINAKQWGVYATREKDVRFICAVDHARSKYGEAVDCSQVLDICEYPNVKFAINTYGNYWAVRSNTKFGARAQVIYQGVLLKR